MSALAIDPAFAERNLNEGFSGGEKKRHEISSSSCSTQDGDPGRDRLGLDIDALKVVSEASTGSARSRATGCC